MNLFKKKTNILIIFTFLLLIFVISGGFLVCNYDIKKNKELEMLQNNNIDSSNMFVILLEQEDGSYHESNSTDWPTDGIRIYNEKLSGCIDINGNKIANSLRYDEGKNKVILETDQSTKCYLHFSFPPPDILIEGIDLDKLKTSKYKKYINCDLTASAIFNQQYQRIEVSNIVAPAECNMMYSADTTYYTTLKNEVQRNANTISNGYRYSGKQPNNWVWFNNELWRIIGSIPTKMSNGTISNLVKIIRNEPIGSFSYDAKDSEFTGAWGSNTLYSLLNTHYYSSNKATMNGQSHSGCYGYYDSKYKPKPNCDYTEIGILSNSYYGQMVEEVYWNTGASSYSVTPSAAYTLETSKQTVSGKVGLLSPSDWGYASYSSYHNITMDLYTSSSNMATESNWLFNGNSEWTLIQDSSDGTKAVYVEFAGYLRTFSTISGLNARPVVYLDSQTYIIKGTGSESNPYQIGI